MWQPLFYVDQNVIGLQLEGKVELSKVEGVRWVYSKVHFAEIRRSRTTEGYLRRGDRRIVDPHDRLALIAAADSCRLGLIACLNPSRRSWQFFLGHPSQPNTDVRGRPQQASEPHPAPASLRNPPALLGIPRPEKRHTLCSPGS